MSKRYIIVTINNGVMTMYGSYSNENEAVEKLNKVKVRHRNAFIELRIW